MSTASGLDDIVDVTVESVSALLEIAIEPSCSLILISDSDTIQSSGLQVKYTVALKFGISNIQFRTFTFTYILVQLSGIKAIKESVVEKEAVDCWWSE